ncbi:dihydrodipicolinate synthase 2 [Nannizzia gypsea CBS 118893]|uniref:Dihydrodipicolinate synthase 2 n=1 Tax=Arthroderma gypseum (strain ATCC MYA-4604 / CBS 118893) TaxID=535722 RepID=E5R3F3_ARTGP|nr:dihydrodipicolinate synthase 2 [Nannizzia gypsea CBS 118893]EFQ97968.1 dihydrodipicolinate synthase 2 [Nannizzia gypsea CBS 118893]
MEKPTRRPLQPGVYVPTMTFFDPATEELDIPTIRAHSVRLAKAGVAGLITMGSNGEAVHLSRAERALVTQHTRSALDDAGFRHIPVISGATDQGVRGTVEICREAADAGAEYILLISPSYYRAAMGDQNALFEYFTKVADGSPLPIILYNFPGVVAGIDMDSDFIIRLSQHPNIIGTKFTCGSTGKLCRVAAAMNAITPASPLTKPAADGCPERPPPPPYFAFGGYADFALQTLVSGGSGIIAGGANVLPRLCVEVFNLWEEGKLAEAMEMQKILSDGDWIMSKYTIPGTKSAIQACYGYGGYPRAPMPRLTEA